MSDTDAYDERAELDAGQCPASATIEEIDAHLTAADAELARRYPLDDEQDDDPMTAKEWRLDCELQKAVQLIGDLLDITAANVRPTAVMNEAYAFYMRHTDGEDY